MVVQIVPTWEKIEVATVPKSVINSDKTNHLIILNIYIQSASANASEYQRYEKDDQVPKE